MTDTSPANPPTAPAPTIVQRALRWFGYIGVVILVWCFMVGSFDSINGPTVYLFIAAFYCCALLAALPETLPARMKAPLAIGGGLAGTTVMWVLDQTPGEFSRYMRLVVPMLMALAARMIADRWVQSETPPAQRDAEAKSR